MSSLGDAMTPQRYAAEWAEDSAGISNAGGYEWMEQQLGPFDRVVEIGCGIGEGTLRLAQTRKVVALEVNIDLLNQTFQKLQVNGVHAEIVPVDALGASTAQVKLVNISAFGGAVQSALGKSSFDAMVCWLIGASPDVIAMATNVPVQKLEGKHLAMYRERLQKQCYALGRKCLRSGGVVHTVDRIYPSPTDLPIMCGEIAQHHAWLAGGGYAVSSVDAALFALPVVGTSAIQYVTHNPSGLPYLASSRAVRK